MPKYRYKAIDAAGKASRGTVVAVSESDAEEKLQQRGLTLIASHQARESILRSLFISRRIKPRELIEFYYRLSQTLELGLPILSALEENEKIISTPYFKKIIAEIRIAIESGNSLYGAMSQFYRVFEPLDLAIVRMGEESGTLPGSLKELAQFLEWKEDIRSTLKRAAIYPSFIVLAIVAVIGVWVGYVLPQMSGLLMEMGVDLPGVTRMVLDISHFVETFWLWILLGILTAGMLIYLYQTTERGKIQFHKYLLKLPIMGNIMANIAIARLSHNFATMYGAGMNINTIFELLSNEIIGNRYMEAQLKKAYADVQRGESISDAMEATPGFPTLLIGAVRNGESTGTIDDAFRRLGNYYDGEVKRSVDTMINAMEPLSIILLGGIFGLIALSIMLPLYDVISEIQ
jgi:type II secretory pathway component PulF